MSWSSRWVGNRNGIKQALAAFSDRLSGESKREFEAARPHLEGLLDQNTNLEIDPVLDLDANGHAYIKDGVVQYSSVQVTLRILGSVHLA